MKLTRREAVQRMGWAAAALGGAPAWGCRAAASATGLGPLGVQLYTLRTAMADDLDGTLARVAEAGYREVEFAGYFGRSAASLRGTLDGTGLSAPSAHVPLDALETAWPATLDDAATLGHRYLVVAWIDAARRQTLDDWRRIADTFNRAGEQARTVGIQFAYHNHDFEFVPLEGARPFDVLCETTDPALVQIELDLYWITHAGGDPRTVFERWPGRVPMVHVKDRRPDGTMVDVGAGAIDWPGILAHRERAGMRHYFVEHDNPADPFASIVASFAYLNRLTL